MSDLHRNAVEALVSLRRKTAENPLGFEANLKDLKSTLDDCAERNHREGNLLRRVGLSNEAFQIRGFPDYIDIDFHDYLVAEYLHFASRHVRRALVSEWREGLAQKAEEAYRANPELLESYNNMGRWSAERLTLKAASIKERANSRVLYAVSRMYKSAAASEKGDWEFPTDLSSKIDAEFEKVNKKLLVSFGMGEEEVTHYYQIACDRYRETRALKYAAAIGVSITAVYGVGRLMAACASSVVPTRTAYDAVSQTDWSRVSLPASGTIPNYGFFTKPEFLAVPYSNFGANQLGFQHLAQGLNPSGAIYLNTTSAPSPFDIARSMTNVETPNYFSRTMSYDPSSSESAMKGIATMLGLGMSAATEASGNMLGSNTSLRVSSLGEGFATLQGTINGSSIYKNIRKIGENITIS